MPTDPVTPVPSAATILDQALALAEQQGWESVRLHQVASALGCGLEDIHCHYREKEALVEAWFDRADRAMLAAAAEPECRQLPRKERLEHLLMCWLGALSGHRRVTRQMIAGKFEPGHLHVLLPGILRVSRTVQWWREAADCEAHDLLRALDEVLYTGIYSATFLTWLLDESEGMIRTRTRLRKQLDFAASRRLGEM